MLRRELLGGFAALAVLGPAARARADVRVHIGINLPGPPALVAIPSSPVVYAPSVNANYFFYSGQYYVFANEAWHVGPGYNGPWAVVAPEFIPRPLLAVPVSYYRVAPPHWRGWHRHEPPRWAPAWGHRWEERAERREDRREDRQERREDRREDRQERREDRREHRRGR
jgi:hypothetical protein